MKVNKEAEALNNAIKEGNPFILSLLSKRGLGIYFPKAGILSQTAEARGKKYNATIGIAKEDDGSPMRLRSLSDAITLDPKDVFPYAPGPGKPELRSKWLEHIRSVNPSLKGRTTLPVVTSGLTHGLSIAGYLFMNEGDKIIIHDRYWENYSLIFENGYGAALDTYGTFTASGFDLAGFRKKLSESTGKKIILLNFPNNPAGYTPTEEEAEDIADTIREYAEKGNDIVVICDDAYFGLVYRDGVFRESMFSKLADIHENVLAVKIDGCSKEDYVWGLRVGFITFASRGITEETCKALEAKTAGAIRGGVSNVSHLSQSLLLKAMSSPDYHKEKEGKYAIMRKRFETVQETLRDSKFSEVLTPLPSNSGYFICLELKPGIDSEKLRLALLEKYDTGIIASGNTVRVAFSGLETRNIKPMLDNIYNACKDNKD